MTKKHYEAIAKIVAVQDDKEAYILYPIINDLADYFQTDNKLFDRSRFLQACGVEKRQCKKCGGDNCGVDICIDDIPF